MAKGDGGRLPRHHRIGGTSVVAELLEIGHQHVESPSLCLHKISKNRPWRIYRICRITQPLNNDPIFTASNLNEVARWIERNYPTNGG